MDALSFTKKCLPQVKVVALALFVTACASSPPPDDQGHADQRGVGKGSDVGKNCVQSGNLLADVNFTESSDWIYTQHAGETSFRVTGDESVLEITRIAGEPWVIYQQKVDLPPGNAGVLLFSADLRGAIETEPPIHGFEHVAGLYLQSGNRADLASIADHQPNKGDWDWQRISVRVPRIFGSTYAWAGFVHQGGGGSLWARNPSLVLMECAESG